jgi:hypothetical protein
VVVKDNVVAGEAESFGDWLRKGGGSEVAGEIITSKVGIGPEKWTVVRFQPSSQQVGAPTMDMKARETR